MRLVLQATAHEAARHKTAKAGCCLSTCALPGCLKDEQDVSSKLGRLIKLISYCVLATSKSRRAADADACLTCSAPN
jgi:hypothetical protein